MAPVSIGFRGIKKGVPDGTPSHVLFGRGLALARSEPAGATPPSFRNHRYSYREPFHDRQSIYYPRGVAASHVPFPKRALPCRDAGTSVILPFTISTTPSR